MNLKVLNKAELDSRIKSLAGKERELLHEILLTVKEIDRRRTYLDLGYSNLFSYLVEGVGYSAGSAQRRIDAARLLNEIPSLGEKIQSGELKLNQISLVQKAAREVQKSTSQKVSSQAKQELLEQLVHQNHQDSEKTVALFFDLPVLQATQQHTQADDSVRVELTLSKELHEKIQEAQALLSHSLPTQDLVKYLEYLTDRVIQSKKGKPIQATKAKPAQDVAKQDAPTAASESGSASAKHATTSEPAAIVAVRSFSEKTKKRIRQVQQCCQYTDPITKKQCGTKWFLQIDHKHSLWAGGTNEPGNAQVLCARHNRRKYQREAGVRWH